MKISRRRLKRSAALMVSIVMLVSMFFSTVLSDHAWAAASLNTSIQMKASGHPNLTSINTVTQAVYAIIGTQVSDLLAQVESTDASVQSYSVTDSVYAPKLSGALVTGDKLVVTAADGISKTTYTSIVSTLYEGETTSVKTSGANITAASPGSDANASGGKYFQTGGTPKLGDWIEFTLHVPAAGTYNLSFQYKTNTTRAIIQPYVDGAVQGGPVDEYSATANQYIVADLGTVTFATAGSHALRFVIVGQNAKSTGLGIVVDYIKLNLLSGTIVVSSNTNIQLKSAGHPNVTAVDTAAHSITAAGGASVAQLLSQIESTDGSAQSYSVTDSNNASKTSGVLATGDKLVVTASDGTANAVYAITVSEIAGSNVTSAGVLTLADNVMTAGTIRNIQLQYNVTSKVPPISGNYPVYPTWNVIFTLPAGITATTTDEVSIIGMDRRKLTSSEISNNGSTVTLTNLGLQPDNGTDVVLYLNAKIVPGIKAQGYEFKAVNQIQGKDFSIGDASEKTTLTVVSTVSDFKRVIKVEKYSDPDYTQTQLAWITPKNAANVKVEMSTDNGGTWSPAAFTTTDKIISNDDVYKITNISGELVDRKPASTVVELNNIVVGLHEIPKYAVGVPVTTANLSNLQLNKNYLFRLNVTGGDNAGISNIAKYYSGYFNIVDYGAKSSSTEAGATDNTQAIQAAFDAAAATGGGTVYVPGGIFGQGTIHLRSNVYLYLAAGSELWGLQGKIDDMGTALNGFQDGGHSHHEDAMFYGQRLDNIKIVGTGLIHGGNAIKTGDPAAGSGQGDKQVSLKLSTNYEFGGYGAPAGTYALNDRNNKLKVQRVGHFQLLSDGVDYMDIHDVYVNDTDTQKKLDSNGNLVGYIGGSYSNRDIFDLMSDSFVSIQNVYSTFSGDDVVKLGSDYALGFVRHSGNYRVDNVEAWTWCNVFQIGSETVGDISNIHVSNINVHQADKSGFSISINDGTHVSNLLLDGNNYMTGTKAPITMTIGNRGRRPEGPQAGLVGGIKDVTLKNIQITNPVGVKSGETWAPTVSGYFNKNTGITTYAENITFDNINIVAKKANPTRSSAQISLGQNASDPVKDAVTVEMPTSYPSNAGSYNVGDIGQRPSYGFYARHVKNLVLKNSSAAFEDASQDDGRYAVALEDVIGSALDHVVMPKFSAFNDYLVKVSKSSDVSFSSSLPLQDMNGVAVGGAAEYPVGGIATPPTAADVAAGITSIAAATKDATRVTLPAVPDGFSVAIKSSDNTAVVTAEGAIIPPSVPTTVHLVLEVTRISDNTAALTGSLSFLVPAKTAAPAAMLTGTNAVVPGQSFDLTYGLSTVNGSVYAQQLTVNYDPAQLVLTSVTPLSSGIFVSSSGAPGRIQIISASEGAAHAIHAGNSAAILRLSFQALPVSQSVVSAVTVSDVTISDGNGVETQAAGTSQSIQITVVDKSALYTLIADAQAKYDAAVEGVKPGQYPAGSKAALLAALNKANAVAGNAAAAQQQVDQATVDLSASLQSFLASVIAAIPEDVNGDGKVSIGDLAIVASHYGETSSSPNWLASADINKDGVIDIIDLTAVAQKITSLP